MDNNNSNMICNPETKVPKTSEMNDCDYLNCVLSGTKSMGNNYATAMSEASNSQLYETINQIFNETKKCGRDLFDLQFKKGWYRLEKADATKISTINQEYEQKLNQLN